MLVLRSLLKKLHDLHNSHNQFLEVLSLLLIDGHVVTVLTDQMFRVLNRFIRHVFVMRFDGIPVGSINLFKPILNRKREYFDDGVHILDFEQSFWVHGRYSNLFILSQRS